MQILFLSSCLSSHLILFTLSFNDLSRCFLNSTESQNLKGFSPQNVLTSEICACQTADSNSNRINGAELFASHSPCMNKNNTKFTSNRTEFHPYEIDYVFLMLQNMY